MMDVATSRMSGDTVSRMAMEAFSNIYEAVISIAVDAAASSRLCMLMEELTGRDPSWGSMEWLKGVCSIAKELANIGDRSME